jgi:hypothetical protein
MAAVLTNVIGVTLAGFSHLSMGCFDALFRNFHEIVYLAAQRTAAQILWPPC